MEIVDVLNKGMNEVGEKFETKEVLTPHLKAGFEAKGKVVLGTIEGDLHDIGKEIVNTLLISVGFEVYYPGIDVLPIKFVNKTREVGAHAIGISALLPLLNLRQVRSQESFSNTYCA